MNIFKKIDLYLNTLINLRISQLYILLRIKVLGYSQVKPDNYQIVPHPVLCNIESKKVQIASIEEGKITFKLLNKMVTWNGAVDWSDSQWGRLWNYHLQYCDFLLQQDLSTEDKSSLIESLYQDLFSGKLDTEPYPASLRSMNVIRWLSQDGPYKNSWSEPIKGESELILVGLYTELHFIRKNPETHLMGNHLLENAFALLMGSEYLNDADLRKSANAIFQSELSEQFLEDGAHYERSVMYHQILLSRILEALTYLPKDDPWVKPFRNLVPKMLAWLHHMRFQNGDLANFNDTTVACKLETDQLIRIARELNLTPESDLELSESGFRKRSFESYEWIMKTGGVAPDHQPGHIHADTFSFILHVRNRPVIVDRGISTYSPGADRDRERATVSHNCVTSGSLNTTDVWGVFRVGRRPHIHLLTDNPAELEMKLHYKPFFKRGFSHRRSVLFEENAIVVTENTDPGRMVNGFLHFHPDIKMVNMNFMDGNSNLNDSDNGSFELLLEPVNIRVVFQGILKPDLFEYDFCEDFNKKVVAQGVRYSFSESCTFKIEMD